MLYCLEISSGWSWTRMPAQKETQGSLLVGFKYHTWVTGRSLAWVLMVTKSFPIVRAVWIGQVEMWVFLLSPAAWGYYNLTCPTLLWGAPTAKCNNTYNFLLIKLLHLVMHIKWMLCKNVTASFPSCWCISDTLGCVWILSLCTNAFEYCFFCFPRLIL